MPSCRARPVVTIAVHKQALHGDPHALLTADVSQVHISHCGAWRLKGVMEPLDAILLLPAQLAPRQFPSRPPSLKAKQACPKLQRCAVQCRQCSAVRLQACFCAATCCERRSHAAGAVQSARHEARDANKPATRVSWATSCAAEGRELARLCAGHPLKRAAGGAGAPHPAAAAESQREAHRSLASPRGRCPALARPPACAVKKHSPFRPGPHTPYRSARAQGCRCRRGGPEKRSPAASIPGAGVVLLSGRGAAELQCPADHHAGWQA